MANTRYEVKSIGNDVDIYQYPNSINNWGEGEPVDLALGDLHANYIKLIYFLITAGVVALPPDKYLELVEIYQTQIKIVDHYQEKIRFDKRISDFNERIEQEKSKAISENYTLETQQNEINRIRGWIASTTEDVKSKGYDPTTPLETYLATLSELKGRAETLLSSIEVVSNARIVLIGDELADRGASDYETLYLLNHLRSKGLAITTILSNHGMDFLKLYEQGNDFSRPSLGMGQAGSVIMLDRYLTGGLTTRDQLDTLVDNYKQTLDLLSYSLSPDKKNITLYTHAPVDTRVIEYIATYFGIDYRATTAVELASTIDLINFNFKKRLEAGTVHELFQKEELIDRATRLSLDDIKADPFTTLIWNRTYDVLTRGAQPAGFMVEYVHGHDDGREQGEELHNVHNLDNHLGKFSGQHNNEGKLTYSKAPAQRVAKVAPNIEDVLDQTQKALLDDLVRNIRALPQAYRDVKGNRTKRNDEMIDLVVKQADFINDRTDLTDDQKRSAIIRLVFESYRRERLHYSGENRLLNIGYVDYLNANQHKERFARMLGLILQSEIRNDERLYLTAGIDQLSLPTISAISPADKSSGKLELDYLKSITIPANDAAYSTITTSQLSNGLILNYRSVTARSNQASSIPMMQSERARQQEANFMLVRQEKTNALNGAIKQIKQMLGVSTHPKLPESLLNSYWDRLSAIGITGVEQMRELLKGESGNAVETAKQVANIIAGRLKAGSARHRDVQAFYHETFRHLVDLIKADSSDSVKTAQREFTAFAEKFFEEVKLDKQFKNVGSAGESIESSSSISGDDELTTSSQSTASISAAGWQAARPSESSVVHNDEVPPTRNQLIAVSEAQQRLDELNGMAELTPEQAAEKKEAEKKVKEEMLASFLNQLKQVIGVDPLVDESIIDQKYKQDYLNNAAKMFWDQKVWGSVKGIEKMRTIFAQPFYGSVEKLATEIEVVVQQRLTSGPGFFSKRHNDVSKLYACIRETINGIRNTASVDDARTTLATGKDKLKSFIEPIRANYEAYLIEKESVGDLLGFDDDDSIKPKNPGKKS
jgi:hypothetical protein